MAGSYFNKVECFCFTDTTLKPGETLDMPVVFYVDPDIADVPELKDITTITLSYTFFPIEEEKPVAAAPQAEADTTRTIPTEISGADMADAHATQNRNTTTTSSTRARGRSSAPSARWSWRSAASPGCST